MDLDISEYCECGFPKGGIGKFDEFGWVWDVCAVCGKEIEGTREFEGEGEDGYASWGD